MEWMRVSSRSNIKVFGWIFLGSKGLGGPVRRGYRVSRKDADGEVGDLMFLGFCCFSELKSRILMDRRGAISSAGEVWSDVESSIAFSSNTEEVEGSELPL